MKCDVCGRTDKECKIREIKEQKLCPKHITQWYRYHRFLDSTIYDKNEYINCGEWTQIVLKNKEQEIVGYAIIDTEDVEKCQQYKWHMKKSRNTNYVTATIDSSTKIFLHRLVLNYTGKDDIDHKNRNGLDNRKSNLEIVTHSKNLVNQRADRKGIKLTPSGRYSVTITKDYQSIYIGTYDSYEEALSKRLEKEQELFYN